MHADTVAPSFSTQSLLSLNSNTMLLPSGHSRVQSHVSLLLSLLALPKAKVPCPAPKTLTHLCQCPRHHDPIDGRPPPSPPMYFHPCVQEYHVVIKSLGERLLKLVGTWAEDQGVIEGASIEVELIVYTTQKNHLQNLVKQLGIVLTRLESDLDNDAALGDLKLLRTELRAAVRAITSPDRRAIEITRDEAEQNARNVAAEHLHIVQQEVQAAKARRAKLQADADADADPKGDFVQELQQELGMALSQLAATDEVCGRHGIQGEGGGGGGNELLGSRCSDLLGKQATAIPIPPQELPLRGPHPSSSAAPA